MNVHRYLFMLVISDEVIHSVFVHFSICYDANTHKNSRHLVLHVCTINFTVCSVRRRT